MASYPHYNVGEIVTAVRALLNDSTERFWSDTEITNWITEAVLDISVKAQCVEAYTPLVLATNTMRYAEPENAIDVVAVFVEDRALMKSHLRQFGHSQAETHDQPLLFSYFAHRVYIYPVPLIIMDAEVAYTKRTKEFGELPDAYHHLTIKYAFAQALLKDRRYAEANQVYAEYLLSLEFQRGTLQVLVPDSQDQLRTPDRTESGSR